MDHDRRGSVQGNPFAALKPKEPTDDELFVEVRRILSQADLMTITKKQVRDQLSVLFKVDLSTKKATINEMIEGILSGDL